MTMDRKVEKARRPLWQWLGIAAVVAGAGWFIYGLLADASIRTYRVAEEQLIVSTVEYGAFEDIIPIRGTIQPFNSFFLDAVAGGTVDEVYVEEGSIVEAGEPLLLLTNNDLRLNVANTDIRITEQINNLSDIVDGFEARILQIERELIEFRYRIKVLERQKAQQEQLVARNLVSQEDYHATVDELEYQRTMLANAEARHALQTRISEDRSAEITTQMDKLEQNQALSQATFEDLLVKAPISGQLTSLPVEIGESKNRGERLGQIDVVDQYKIVAQVDEYYVTRVSPGQSASFSLAGQEYNTRVDKVYPEITEGTFEMDLIFEGVMPVSIRRGQTLQMELTLGNPVESLLLPVGGFIQDTGGNWVFVLNETGDAAFRHDIRAGRRNNRYVEVIEGLEQGDRVITSGYGQMGDMERIQLTR